MNKSGILLHIGGLWMLSALDASGKWLVMAGVPVLMVAWVRYAGHSLLMTAVVLPSRGTAIFRTQSLSRQLVRGLMMITTTVLFFSVLGRLPLAEGTAINFMAPLFLMAMAPWLLNEAHRLHRWLGVLAGFAGMLIVVRPGAQLDPVGVALGLATALAFAFFQISTRRVAHDDPLTTNYYAPSHSPWPCPGSGKTLNSMAGNGCCSLPQVLPASSVTGCRLRLTVKVPPHCWRPSATCRLFLRPRWGGWCSVRYRGCGRRRASALFAWLASASR